MQNVQIAGGVNTNRLIPMKGEKMSEEKAIKDLQKNLHCSHTSWDELVKMYYSAKQQIQQLQQQLDEAKKINSQLKPDYKYCPNCGWKIKVKK